jgi:hypothetical protein
VRTQGGFRGLLDELDADACWPRGVCNLCGAILWMACYRPVDLIVNGNRFDPFKAKGMVVSPLPGLDCHSEFPRAHARDYYMPPFQGCACGERVEGSKEQVELCRG